MDNRSHLYKIADPNPEIIMGDDPYLPSMPEAPTLLDFFKLRFGPIDHLLQSARLAMLAGQNEKVILACLLHDVAVVGFIRGEHGYWGEQMVAPYVDEEVSWAIRAHQALRFFPDEAVGYAYPDAYVTFFGADYRPDPYIVREYEQARGHRFYGTARAITVYDIYAFDPDVTVDVSAFTDIIGRHFRQPPEGLGWDNTPASHIWRTIMRPNKFL
jgi:hypothetical protein